MSIKRVEYEEAMAKVAELKLLGHTNMNLSKLIRIALEEIQVQTLHTDDTYDA